jgi:hypothetical protein
MLHLIWHFCRITLRMSSLHSDLGEPTGRSTLRRSPLYHKRQQRPRIPTYAPAEEWLG